MDRETLVAASYSSLSDVDDFDVTAVNERILEVVNGALLAYDDDFDVLGVDGLALDDSDILDMESIELVVEPSS